MSRLSAQQAAFYRGQYGTDPTKDSWHYMRRDRLSLIRMYHTEKGDGTVDDITWNDLEMDDVFLRINHTRSYIGEQVLYHRLHDTSGETDYDAMEDGVRFFDENETPRILVEKKLAALGKANASYPVSALLKYVSGYEKPYILFFRLMQLLLLLSFFGMLLLRSPGVILAFILVACCNLTIYMHEKFRLENTLACFGGVCGLVDFCEKMEKERDLPEPLRPSAIRRDIDALRKLKRVTGHYIARKNAAVTDPHGLLADYLLGITLWELTSFNSIVRLIRGSEASVLRLFEYVGGLDAMISIASFRRSLGTVCVPHFREDDKIRMQGIYHPLLENPVPNSVVLGRNSIIMGANASGKSTFMKAVAVNLILAQTIHTCSAEYFASPRVPVMTSMAIRDDITTGESYYVREIKYLKRMVDSAQNNERVFFAIDEILKGTNPEERLAASKAVLHFLAGKSCFALVATHDRELIREAEGLFGFYHFESTLTDTGIRFDYRLRNGIGGGSNAISLLEYFRFPEELVSDAKSYLKEMSHENQ